MKTSPVGYFGFVTISIHRIVGGTVTKGCDAGGIANSRGDLQKSISIAMIWLYYFASLLGTFERSMINGRFLRIGCSLLTVLGFDPICGQDSVLYALVGRLRQGQSEINCCVSRHLIIVHFVGYILGC